MWKVARCSDQTVCILLGTHRIQLAWLTKRTNKFMLHAYQAISFELPATFTNPTALQRTINVFLQQHGLLDAAVSLALDLSNNIHTIHTDQEYPEMPNGYAWHTLPLDQNSHISIHTGIKQYHVAQGKLLAINTPFHCAGITTYQLAQLHSAQQLGQSWPVPTNDIRQHIATLCAPIDIYKHIEGDAVHAILPEDLFCIIGLYTMTR